MDPKSPFRNGPNETQRKQLNELRECLKRHFRAWIQLKPNQVISEGAFLIYLRALEDIPPKELDIACEETLKTCTSFPLPSHIREAWASWKVTQKTEFLGPGRPQYLDEPLMSEEERKACLDDLARMKKESTGTPLPISKHAVSELEIPESQRTLEEQKAALREKGFLHDPKCLCGTCRKARELRAME